MSIIVKTLIVIGIIISVILLIILAIILYPFKYEFNSSYKDKEFKIDFKYFIITFFTNINIGFPVKYTLQIFNKVLFDSEKKLEKSQNNEFDDKKHESKESKSIGDTDFIADKTIEKQVNDSDAIVKDLFISAKKSNEEIKKNEEVTAIKEKDEDTIESIDSVITRKIDELIDKIDNLIPHDMIYVIEKIYNEVKKLPKSILPKKYELNIKYGISDPYTYGISYAILAPLTGILDENLKVDPTFGKNNFESELNVSKRVPLYKIIEPALKLLLDKKFRSIVFNKNDLDDEDRSKDIGE